jgi:hypothetical protein
MNQSETIDPATIPKPEFPPTVNLNKIDGKAIHVTGYTVNRGKPNDYTNPEDIGEDGLTEYRTISTAESFDIENKDGKKQSYSHFYVSPAVLKQVQRFEGEFKAGKRVGPFKSVLRKKTDSPNQSYRALANQSDEDYN